MLKSIAAILNSSAIRQLIRIILLVVLFGLVLPATALADPPLQEGVDDCATCHQEESTAWKNSTHAKGASYGLPGATCIDCHDHPAFQKHPEKSEMSITTDSSVCKDCHANTFDQWKGSHHAENGVQCIGCHLSHSQDFRLIDDALCGSCHRDRLEDFSHTAHSHSHVTCADCHMAPISGRDITDTTDIRDIAPSHNFSGVPAENCVKCHEQNIHTKEDASMHCGECHQETTEAWQSSPHARAVSQGNKLGATCEDCHGSFVENHPKKGALRLTADSSVCGECHTHTFEQWKDSRHGQGGVQCIDCHRPHSQEFQLTDGNLCGSCHGDRLEEFSHSTHSQVNVTCADCHLAPASIKTSSSGDSDSSRVPSHSFSEIPSENCARCHAENIHKQSLHYADQITATQTTAMTERIPELTKQLENTQQANRWLRTMVLISLGAGLGLGWLIWGLSVKSKKHYV